RACPREGGGCRPYDLTQNNITKSRKFDRRRLLQAAECRPYGESKMLQAAEPAPAKGKGPLDSRVRGNDGKGGEGGGCRPYGESKMLQAAEPAPAKAGDAAQRS
ncbi:MAG: hypothetical protein FWF41_04325, partial [Betaproteobacteria bacterium]|nr:hypothetical protein [Betaproteobacteria bacterium]